MATGPCSLDPPLIGQIPAHLLLTPPPSGTFPCSLAPPPVRQAPACSLAPPQYDRSLLTCSLNHKLLLLFSLLSSPLSLNLKDLCSLLLLTHKAGPCMSTCYSPGMTGPCSFDLLITSFSPNMTCEYTIDPWSLAPTPVRLIPAHSVSPRMTEPGSLAPMEYEISSLIFSFRHDLLFSCPRKHLYAFLKRPPLKIFVLLFFLKLMALYVLFLIYDLKPHPYKCFFYQWR